MATDLEAPKLVSIGIDHLLLDIDLGETNATVTAHLTDDLSGVFDGQFADGSSGPRPHIRFVSPSGQTVTGVFDIRDPVSGDLLDGWFRASITLGLFAEEGRWSVDHLFLADEAGNTIDLLPGSTPSLGAVSFVVDNDNSDAAPPTLASISLSDTAIDMGSGETTLSVTAHMEDNLSGLFDGEFADGSGGPSPRIDFVGPGGQIVSGVFDIHDPAAGSRLDGLFRASITLDPFTQGGRWTVRTLFVSDEAGNSISLEPGSATPLRNLFFDVVNVDTTAPLLETLQLGLPVLNPDGTATFTVTAHLTDDLAGMFDGVFADGRSGPPAQIRFVSATGDVAIGVFDISNPVAGNRNDGVFRAPVTLSPLAEAGIWKVDYLLLNDEAGNARFLYPDTSQHLTGATIHLGSASNDVIAGTPLPDAVYSFDGADNLRGGNGDDTLAGGDGDDRVEGGKGKDQIVGGSGGAGNDTYVGGSGSDTVIYASASGKVSVSLEKGKASGAEIGKDKLKSIESVVGGKGKDTLKGDDGKNVLAGHEGDDRLNGAGGKDSLDGGEGGDVLKGGKGKDCFFFRGPVETKRGVDVIKDFESKDKLCLLSDAFAAIGDRLEKKEFEIGKKADDANDYVVLKVGKRKDTIFYDRDGDGAGKKIAVARLDGDSEVSHKDFKIIDDFVL